MTKRKIRSLDIYQVRFLRKKKPRWVQNTVTQFSASRRVRLLSSHFLRTFSDLVKHSGWRWRSAISISELKYLSYVHPWHRICIPYNTGILNPSNSTVLFHS